MHRGTKSASQAISFPDFPPINVHKKFSIQALVALLVRKASSANSMLWNTLKHLDVAGKRNAEYLYTGKEQYIGRNAPETP